MIIWENDIIYLTCTGCHVCLSDEVHLQSRKYAPQYVVKSWFLSL